MYTLAVEERNPLSFCYPQLVAEHFCVLPSVSLTLYSTICYVCVFSLENPNAPKPWGTERDERPMNEMDIRRREAAIYEREYAMYERSARLEELERMYFERYPPVHHPPRDPYYDRYYDHDRYYDRPPPLRDPYMEQRYRLGPDMERGRYHDRPPMGAPTSFERAYYDSRDRSYDRPRDDPYERREKDSFRDHSLRDREPFERFDSSRRL